jgi:lactate racemase
VQVKLAYGKEGLTINLPAHANVTLVEPAATPGLPDERQALLDALRNPIASAPLAELVAPGQTVAVVFSDITRPMPSDRVLPAVLEELESRSPAQIVLINALGTHRPNSPEELERMLGPDIVARYRIIQHDPWDEANLVSLGESRFGHPLKISRAYMDADVKVLTGFIEPHFFAGFSGGPKAVLPGVAGHETIMQNHSTPMLNHPNVRWGVFEGNPVWQEMMEAAERTSPDFLVNVTLNSQRAITAVFAGDMRAAHAQGMAFVREHAMIEMDRRFDIVISSNAGYPLDLNLYQAVKGMSAAAQVVKPGGHIIVAAECWDGIPDHGEYRRLLHSGREPAHLLELMSAPGFMERDQWQVAVQAKIQLEAQVYLKSTHLSDEEVHRAHVTPCHDVDALLAELIADIGPGASICVLPEGPLAIPYVTEGQ